MVRGNNQDFRLQSQNTGNQGVGFFNSFFFCFIIAVFSCRIGLFYMNIEKIEIIIIFFQGIEKVLNFCSDVQDTHACEFSQTHVHRVISYSCRFQFVQSIHGWKVRIFCKSPQKNCVGFWIVL